MNKLFENKFKEKNIKKTDKISILSSLIDKKKSYKQRITFKPNGIWYSFANLDTNSWISFCIENNLYNMIDINKKYLYKLNIPKKYFKIFNSKTILPISKFSIIRIRNFKDLYFFTEKYKWGVE